ncbi:unnamed protein product [Euphydryas editha]|uniref:BRCT domain-containing protein n=1 Tax=Euphydryas editha TaxID=104508 RepID=A0AAU9TWM0_EUPED|nr:unnamed protein product [Euphydryas editha]
MPRVKIDYVVSFSSEDPDNPANNLLEWEISKKKWLCSKGESSCSVVLQLTKAVKIESINIGAYHAASVEVLVGLSEKPNDPFEVLVPTSMLLSPSESRREAVERVRSFSGAALAAARERRWDRVRLVCTQPYNKHCKYGLSFVHIHEPEGPSLKTFPHALALESLPSDDEEFRPGELFAQHSQRASTDAQIRQASMEAIKNNSDKSTKLLKTPITKASCGDRRLTDDDTPRSNRQKESLMYTEDDDKPHDKIDQVVERHKRDKDKEKTPRNQKTSQNYDREKPKLNTSRNDKDKTNSNKNDRNKESKTEERRTEVNQSTPRTEDSENVTGQSGQKKRKRSDESRVLAGVRFTLSGYENPRRGELRAAALALGARYVPTFTRDCTHLVCAFPNTPKLREARAAGSRAVAVSGEWLAECRRARRRVPWRWFAVEPRERESPPPGWRDGGDRDDDDDTEVDTDDEIEKVVRQQEKKKRLKSPAPSNETSEQDDAPRDKGPDAPDTRHAPSPPGDTRHSPSPPGDTRHAGGTQHASPDGARDEQPVDSSRESDVTFVCDERMRGHVALDSDSDSDVTRCDERAPAVEEIDDSKVLPDFFEGLTFSLADELRGEERARLARYIRAYGGLVLQESESLGEGAADYRVCGVGEGAGRSAGEGAEGRAGGERVSPEWVWRCHRLRARAPP